MIDLVLIHPGAAHEIYQGLASYLAAHEPPMWCRLIAGFIRDRGYTVIILDAEALDLSPLQAAQHAIDLKPRLVGVIAFGHQPSASTQQMVGASATIRALRELAPDLDTVLAGGHVSALPHRTMQEELCTYAAKGESPQTFLGLLDGTPPQDVPGLAWRDDEKNVHLNATAPLLNPVAHFLHGDTWNLLPMDKYRAHNWQCFSDLSKRSPYASIYTSLGCPFKCLFCCIAAPFGSNSYRMRDPHQVVDEIVKLMFRYGVHTFKIEDEMFVLNDRHVNAICDEIIKAKIGDYLNVWAYARVDTVKSNEQLDKLRAAGVKWLALGIESGSKHVRDGAVKALKNDDILGVVRRIQAAGINVIGNYIFGLPDDTHESMQQTLDLALEANCEFANFYSAMAYPGSWLYTEAVKQGWRLPEKWSGYSQHSYDTTPLATETLTNAEVLYFRDHAFQVYFRDPKYLGMINRKFGSHTVQHIDDMVNKPLPRLLLSGKYNLAA